MAYAGTITALTTLAVLQGHFNGLLISFVAMLSRSSRRVEALRQWMS